MKKIIALVGFRCSGKSTIRKILTDANIPVFDTNSVKTNDADANQISIKEVLKRYGKNSSYLIFLKPHIKKFIMNNEGPIFIDSLKIGKDIEILNQLFPDIQKEIWYLHAKFTTRNLRYKKRDLETNFRSEDLTLHDTALEEAGIWDLIKNADEVVNMENNIDNIKSIFLKLIKKKMAPNKD